MSRQFDVHSNVFAQSDLDPPFLVYLQSDHLAEIRTVVVAPLWQADEPHPTPPVDVAVRFLNEQYWLALNEMAFVRRSDLGSLAGNIGIERDRIVRGHDLLLTGI